MLVDSWRDPATSPVTEPTIVTIVTKLSSRKIKLEETMCDRKPLEVEIQPFQAPERAETAEATEAAEPADDQKPTRTEHWTTCSIAGTRSY